MDGTPSIKARAQAIPRPSPPLFPPRQPSIKTPPEDPMSPTDQNKQTILHYTTAFNAGDLQALRALFTPTPRSTASSAPAASTSPSPSGTSSTPPSTST